jgi:glc operon protein GlcG
MHFKPSLVFSVAKKLLFAALGVARERGAAVSIAVVDEAGELLALARMDGARFYTVDIASEKASGAAKLGLPTAALEPQGRKTASGNPWLRGGKPVLCDGQCAGAIGVSGAKPEIDVEIVERALASFDVLPGGSS